MKTLLELVDDINAEQRNSDDCRLKAAINMATVHKRISNGDSEANGMKWEDFATTHFDWSWSEIKKLVKIGLSDDPEKAMADHREKTRKAVAKHRKSEQQKSAYVSAPGEAEADGGGDSPKQIGEKGGPEPGTVELIIYAYEAADDEAHNLFHDWLHDKFGYEVVSRDLPVTREAMPRLAAQAIPAT